MPVFVNQETVMHGSRQGRGDSSVILLPVIPDFIKGHKSSSQDKYNSIPALYNIEFTAISMHVGIVRIHAITILPTSPPFYSMDTLCFNAAGRC